MVKEVLTERTKMAELALSIQSEYQKNRTLLSKPVSTLARMAGLNANQVYKILLPELIKPDLGESLRYAETGLKYIQMVDRNRLREEIGEDFIIGLELMIDRVQDGLESSKGWIKRKAISLHGTLIDEASERKRFVETILTANAVETLRKSQENVKVLEDEILTFENNNGETYEWESKITE